MKKVETNKAPAAIGPYSQAVVVGDQVYCSGQIGLDPKTQNLVSGGVLEETRQILKNLEAVLKKAGSGLDMVVKTDIFVKDLSKFSQINDVYSEFFKQDPMPARATVEVSNLPKGASIEIACIAIIK